MYPHACEGFQLRPRPQVMIAAEEMQGNPLFMQARQQTQHFEIGSKKDVLVFVPEIKEITHANDPFDLIGINMPKKTREVNKVAGWRN